MIHPLEAFVRQRREHLTQHGLMAIDAILGVAQCTKCNGVGVIAIGANRIPAYESLDEFARLAKETGDDLARNAPAQACGCGGALKPSSVEYYAHHSGLERDVVGVWTPKKAMSGKSSVALFVWDPFAPSVREMSPLGEMSSDAVEQFVHDAHFRGTWFALEGDADNAADIIEHLVELYPRDPLRLRFLPLILQRRKMQPALSLADRHRRECPEDADGHAAFGEILFTAIRHDLEPRARLDEARTALDTALSLAPDHRDAMMAVGNVLMFEARLDEARSTFLGLVSRHPDHAAAQFNAGVLLIDTDPAAALVHFQAGERVASTDADYPVGCARALLALGRKQEATEALKRARNLTSTHPRFRELEQALTAP
jgi:tetratricopeptide (TPR) repeat protein